MSEHKLCMSNINYYENMNSISRSEYTTLPVAKNYVFSVSVFQID